MNKTEAAEKVAKLRRLARGTPNVHEASVAKAQADRLAKTHGLTENDVASGERAAAFDDLIDGLHRFVANHPALPRNLPGSPSILGIILDKVKGLDKVNKGIRLGHLATIIKTVHFIAGDDPSIKEIKRILDNTLDRHEIKP